MKKLALVLAFALLTGIWMTACASQPANTGGDELLDTLPWESNPFEGSYHRNFDEFILEYDTFNTTMTWSVDLSEGDSLAVDLVVDTGDLSVLIEDEAGNVFYQNDSAETEAFDLEVTESGRYTVTVVGAETQGKASFKKA